MTQETYIEEIGKVLKNKKTIERELEIKITNKGKLVFVEGSPENEFLGLEIIEAINLGFSIERALLLKSEEMILQIINIKSITKRNDLERVRGRIIGTYGKTLANLKKLTDCFIAVYGNQIGIIGNVEDIDHAIIAVRCLIQGSKQGNVYAKLEKEKKKKRNDPFSYTNIKNELKSRHRN